MKKHLFLAIFLFAFSGCHKDVNLNSASSMQSNNSVAFTDTVKIPINDLGTGTYMGFTGGLYPGGVNTPPFGIYALDLAIFASKVVPYSSKGKIDSSAKGKIGFICIGGSTCGDVFLSLKNKTEGNPATNPRINMVSCAWGGGKASVNNIMNPNDPYWTHVSQSIQNRLKPNQVQVIYFETEDSASLIGFPDRPYKFRDDFEAAMRMCKAKFSNLKLVYVMGRPTTFFRKEIQHREPSPYYNGWGLKFAIEDQINGVPGMKYDGADAVAPLVTWAWYEWANGTTTPRQDGFVWTPNMTADGLHANTIGLDTLSNRFQNFLLTDPAARIWYANHTTPKN